MGEARTYRLGMGEGRYRRFAVKIEESDLWIGIEAGSFRSDLPFEIAAYLDAIRSDILLYAQGRPEFLASFEPLAPRGGEPLIVSKMLAASRLAGVGPMAAVAGAISDAVLAFIRSATGARDIAVENGGDDSLLCSSRAVVALRTGNGPYGESSGIELPAGGPYGIASSSGTEGHSFSYGRADACVVLADTCAVADAWATAFGNLVGSAADIPTVLEKVGASPGVKALVVACEGAFGLIGDVKLVPLKARGASVSDKLRR